MIYIVITSHKYQKVYWIPCKIHKMYIKWSVLMFAMMSDIL